MSRRFVALLLAGVALISCRSINPEAPEIEVKEFEVPKQPPSMIKVPIKIDLKPYFKETDAAVPKEFRGEEKQCEDVSYKYYFKRSPLEFYGSGDHLLFGVTGKYWIKLNYCIECTGLISSSGTCLTPRVYASCGTGSEGMRKMQVAYTSKIGVTSDYKLKSKTKVKLVKALSPCKVTVFNYNATSTLEDEIHKAMKYACKDIDKEIAAIDLRPEMEYTWNVLWEPIDLDGYGYMYLKPNRVALSDITYQGDTAYFDAYLKAYPNIILDSVPITPKPLPDLGNFEQDEGFDIHMDITADYDSLSSILTKDLKGMKLDIKGKEVVFGDIEVHGASNHRISIKVDFSGSKKGTLFLTGTPVFDAEKQHISFPDMEFDLKTKSALLKSAKWLLDKKITSLIREYSSMDLKPYLEEMKTSLDASLNGEVDTGIYMTGKVDEILIDLIYPRENDLFMRVQSKGTLGIQM